MARDADLRLRLPARLPKNTPKDVSNARRRAQLVLIAQAGISLAAPYALLAGMIALVTRNEITQPFLGEALVSHLRAGLPRGLAGHRQDDRAMALDAAPAARAAAFGRGRHVRRTGDHARGGRRHGARRRRGELRAGPGAVRHPVAGVRRRRCCSCWSRVSTCSTPSSGAMAYIVGPGFAVGTGTLVAPTGVQLGTVPSLPILGALPEAGPTPAWVMVVIAVPFMAGAVAGILVVRISPSPSYEGAPLWGFVCGLATGAAAGLLAALSGGSLGGARLSRWARRPGR